MKRLLPTILLLFTASAQAQSVHVHEQATFSFDPSEASSEPADFGGLYVSTEPIQGWNPAEGTLIHGSTEVSLELTCRFRVENLATEGYWQRVLVQHYMNAPILFNGTWHGDNTFGYGADAWLFPGEFQILETHENFRRTYLNSDIAPLALWDAPNTFDATAYIERITIPQIPDTNPNFDIVLLSVEGALHVDVTFIVITSSQTNDISTMQHRLLLWVLEPRKETAH